MTSNMCLYGTRLSLGRKPYGKKRISRLLPFSPFIAMFSTGFFLGIFKIQNWVVKGLPFPKKALVFMCLHYKNFENTVGKGKWLKTSNFSFTLFYLFEELSASFMKTQNCCLQTLSIWKRLKIVVWETKAILPILNP